MIHIKIGIKRLKEIQNKEEDPLEISETDLLWDRYDKLLLILVPFVGQ